MRRIRTLLTVAAIGLGSLTLSACGATGGTGTGSAAAGPSRANEPASQILADTTAALRQVHSFHIDEKVKFRDGELATISGDFAKPNKVSLTYTEGTQQLSMRWTGGYYYLTANGSFYANHGFDTYSSVFLGATWYRFTLVRYSRPGQAFVSWTKPTQMASCLLAAQHVTDTTVAGTSKIAGLPIVKVRKQYGDGHMGQADISATGPSLPLEIDTSDAHVNQACAPHGSALGSIKWTKMSITDYDWPIHIGPPPGVVFHPLGPQARPQAAKAQAKPNAKPKAKPSPQRHPAAPAGSGGGQID